MKEDRKPEKKQGLIGRLFDRLDRKMKEKASEKPCCAPKKDKPGGSCC